MQFEPIQKLTATEQVSNQIEMMILSNELPVGTQLPPERDLAVQFNVSRAVVHNALAEMTRLGFITTSSRHGNYVADFSKYGNLETLNRIISYQGSNLRPSLVRALFHIRQTLEVDILGLICETKPDLRSANQIYQRILNTKDAAERGELHFRYQHELAQLSGNKMYPLLIWSFRSIYLTLGKWLFTTTYQPALLEQLHALNAALNDYDTPKVNALIQAANDDQLQYLLGK